MSASNTPIGFLNPNVYLNNIPPSEALQVEASRNINLVVLGVNGLVSSDFKSLIGLYAYAGHHLGHIGLYLGRRQHRAAQ